ncbi:DUF2252 domain-containing protein [Leifsonia sp. NPDC058230]|uniref:DUF2252 domain-containing protein n=1 Tax=Leifsonia sp. NPDC058230 TaxID=3346391 RepID=UPI0036DC018F
MITTNPETRKTLQERTLSGKRAREETPPSAHADWEPAADRPDPVALLVEQNRTRETDLVPVRHGRMMLSPFTFYRGAAKIMAADLTGTPTAGLDVQLCGDAHLSNFGGFASPERQLVFDLNDFDETLPGPFEYDLKRMAASFTIAAVNNGFDPKDSRAVTVESVKAYRDAMAAFAGMPTLDVWYAHMSEHDLQEALKAVDSASGDSPEPDKKKHGKHDKGKSDTEKSELKSAMKATNKALAKGRARDSLQALAKLVEVVDGQERIVSQPPLIVPLRDLTEAWGLSADGIHALVEDQFEAYKASLSDDRRELLERFAIVDMARKVVGVGSVGTRAFIVLLQGRDTGDPLFLQVKEATRSVLEDHLPKSRYATSGQRVVEGQKLTQATSDIFLGWTKGVQDDRYYYWRQLRDMKTSADVESMSPFRMTLYARMCGWTLARAHARSGDPVAIAESIGTDADLDQAIATFSARYAEQNSRDYQAFVSAVKSGKIEAERAI